MVIIAKLRNLNDLYRQKYAEYDIMAEDVVIQSALELYADDSTQLDTNIKKIVNVPVEQINLFTSEKGVIFYIIIKNFR